MNYGYSPFMRPIPGYYNPAMLGVTQQGQDLQGFQPQYQQSPNVAQSQQSDSSMIWVLGKNEAESYPVAPNGQVVLWDKNAPTLYVKSMSVNGVPSMRILDFTERSETGQKSDVISENNFSDRFVSIADFKALRKEFEELKTKYDVIERINIEKNIEKSSKSDKKTKGSDE